MTARPVRETFHAWIAGAAAVWSLVFAGFHVAWAAGWYIGLDADRARAAFARPAFLAYDLIVAGMCLAAAPVSLALGLSWGMRLPRRLLLAIAAVGTGLLVVRAVASLAYAGYELAAGRFVPAQLGVWEPWFYVGAVLFAGNLWLYRRRDGRAPVSSRCP